MSKIEKAIEALKEAMKTEDKDNIENLTNELMTASEELSAVMQSQSQAQQEAPTGDQAQGVKPEGDVVDAEFEEVKDDDKK